MNKIGYFSPEFKVQQALVKHKAKRRRDNKKYYHSVKGQLAKARMLEKRKAKRAALRAERLSLLGADGLALALAANERRAEQEELKDARKQKAMLKRADAAYEDELLRMAQETQSPVPYAWQLEDGKSQVDHPQFSLKV